MLKLSFAAIISACLFAMNPVLADDDYDDGDYSAAPVAHKTMMSKSKTTLSKNPADKHIHLTKKQLTVNWNKRPVVDPFE